MSFLSKNYFFITAIVITFALQQLNAKGDSFSKFHVTYLVSNTGGAEHLDPNLINPWGLFVAKNGNIFVADNGTNLITSYNKKGEHPVNNINALSFPTGLEENDSDNNFLIPGTHYPATFILASENGTILAYNGAANHNNAIVVADRSAFGSVYKGLALGEHDGKHYIYAADFHNAKIDMFDTNFNYVSSFTDPSIPAGFAPFNIQKLHHQLFVTFAKQKGPDNHDDQPGPGNGYVDIFEFDGTLERRLVSNGLLNSPWGVAFSTRQFGRYSHALLVGNFGDGIINAYDLDTGIYLGSLMDKHGNQIVIDGLWSIMFKSHEARHLYFSAGPDDESNGLIGFIEYID